VVRQAAADVLLRLNGESALERSPAALLTSASHCRTAAVAIFVEYLQHPDRDLRLAAVEALGRIQDPAAHDGLAKVATTSTEDKWIRLAAEDSLGRLRPPEPKAVLSSDPITSLDKIVPLVLAKSGSYAVSKKLSSR